MTQTAGGRPLAGEKPVLKVRAVPCAKEFEHLPRREDDSSPRIDDEERRIAATLIRPWLRGVE